MCYLTVGQMPLIDFATTDEFHTRTRKRTHAKRMHAGRHACRHAQEHTKTHTHTLSETTALRNFLWSCNTVSWSL